MPFLPRAPPRTPQPDRPGCAGRRLVTDEAENKASVSTPAGGPASDRPLGGEPGSDPGLRGAVGPPAVPTSMGFTVMVRAESSQSISLSLPVSWSRMVRWCAARIRNTPRTIMNTRKLTHTTITTVAVLGTTATGRTDGSWPRTHRGRRAHHLPAQTLDASLGPVGQQETGKLRPAPQPRLSRPCRRFRFLVGPGPQHLAARLLGAGAGLLAGAGRGPQSYLRTDGGWPGCDPRDRRRSDAQGGRTAAGRPCGWRAPWGWPCGSRSPAADRAAAECAGRTCAQEPRPAAPKLRRCW